MGRLTVIITWLLLGMTYILGLPVGAIVAFFGPPKGRRLRGLTLYIGVVASVFLVSYWVPMLYELTWRPVTVTFSTLF
jgi:hypothetical protein